MRKKSGTSRPKKPWKFFDKLDQICKDNPYIYPRHLLNIAREKNNCGKCNCDGDIGFGLNWNRCALQQSLFIQYVKTEKYNNIESLKQLAIDRCTYEKKQRLIFREIVITLFSWQARSQQTYLAITTRLLNRKIPLSRP